MTLYRRGKIWWAAIATVQGRQRCSLKTENQQAAKARYAELRNQAERERVGLEVRDKNPDKLTLSMAVDRHLAGPAKKQAQHGRLTHTFNKHIKRDPIGALPLERVTRGEIARWLDRKEAEGLSVTTCNRLKANLSAVFTELMEREEWKGDNPCARVRQRKQKQAKARNLPDAAVFPLIENAPTKHWQVAFALAAFAGLRRGEIERLLWEDVDIDARTIFVRISKTGVSRLVGMHRELVPLLKDARGDAGKNELVVPYAGWPKSAVIIRNALKRANVDVPTSVQACFHSLRHTWATAMANCGADPFITRFMGWGPPKNDVMASAYMKPRAILIIEIDKLHYPKPGETKRKRVSQSRHRGAK